MKSNFRFIGKLVFGLFLVAIWSMGLTVQAEEGLSIEVNIRNASISYEANQATLSFDLTNGQGAQSGIKYGVQLMKNDTVVDEWVSDEVINMKENEVLSKTIQYTAPAFLVGEYAVRVVAKNLPGIPLAVENVGSMHLNGNNFYLEIRGETCSLRVAGESSAKEYSPLEGVDIASDEKLVANCKIKNHFNIPIKFKPVFETYYRSTFGEKISTSEAMQAEGEITLQGDEEKQVSFTLPKADSPQAYDTKLLLLDARDGKLVSNFTVFHYVLRGASATIQNIQLDKEAYDKGETAKVSFLWTPSADSFYDSRAGSGTALDDVVIEGVMEGCSDVFHYTPTENTLNVSTIEVLITNKCQDPKVSLSIKSGDQILAESTFNVESKKKDFQIFLISSVAVLFLLLIIFLVKVTKGKEGASQGIKTLLLGLIFFGSVAILGGVKEVKAASWAGPLPPDGYYSAFFTYSINMNSDPIPIRLQQLTSGGCNNAGLSVNNGHIEVFHDGQKVGQTMEWDATKKRSIQKKVLVDRSTTPGTHTVKLDFYAGRSHPFGTRRPPAECISCSALGSQACYRTDLAGSHPNYDFSGCLAHYDTGNEWFPECTCCRLKPTAPSECSGCSYSPATEWVRASWNCPPIFSQSLIGTKSYTYTVADQAPSCNVNFSPTAVDENGQSTLTLNFTGGQPDTWDYTCTGPIIGSNHNIPYSGTPFTTVFDYGTDGTGAGTENCTASVHGSGGSGNCSASMTINSSTTPVNGACGTADGRTYAETDTTYSPYTQCSSGSPTTTAFPPAGSSQSWTCLGSGGGSDSGTCTASRDACIPGTWTPPASETCSGTPVTQSNGCSTRTTDGTKACPTCTATFDPASVTSPGSSTLTWSSQNADDIKYTCTGPVAGGADWGIIPLNSPNDNPVVFNFEYGPVATESCDFTVKDNTGEQNTCITNDTPITPPAPSCTLTALADLVLSGDSLGLDWTSTFSQAGQINATPVSSLISIPASAFSDPLVATGTTAVTPVAISPPPSQDITFTGTFSGYGGTVNCSASPAVTVVADPPAFTPDGAFQVSDTKTGTRPEASWGTENVAKCDLRDDRGHSQLNICDSEASCASFNGELANKVFEDTEYILTCYHKLYDPASPDDLVITASFDPTPHFTLSADPLEVTVDFVGGGATAKPPVELEMTSMNGYRNLIEFDVDFSNLPPSPGTDVSSVSLDPSDVSFASSPYTKTALMEIYAAYRFTGEETIEVCDMAGIRCVTITILGKKTTPIYEPI